jgi:hypothetical protein
MEESTMAEIDNRNWDDLQVASGAEVNAAAWHVALPSGETSAPLTSKRSMKEKLRTLQAASASRAAHLRDGVSNRTAAIRNRAGESASRLRNIAANQLESSKNSVLSTVAALRADAGARVEEIRRDGEERFVDMKSDMRTNPGKWAGIGAGAGFAVGLVGRFLRHRARVHRGMQPRLVIVRS